MDRQSLGNKVDICQIGSVGMYYHFYYIAFFLQVYKKNQWEKFFLKCDANVRAKLKTISYEYDMLEGTYVFIMASHSLWPNTPANIREIGMLGIMICIITM